FERLEYAGKSRGAAADAVGRISNLCFLNRPDNRLWFISKYSRPSKRANGIEVHVFDNGGVEREKILAKEGVFDDGKIWWFFTDGQVINFDENGAALKSEYFKRRDFDNFRDDPEVMRLAMSRAKDLSLYELRRLISASGGGDSEIMRPYAVKLAGVWASPFACVIVVAIAIPFSIAGVRTNPMVGVSKTAGLFFGYYILDSVFSSMGTTGVLPITLAAWIPNIFMLAFALSLYRKHV
ncbi:MAG: LptF/LptG family permease, partial [Opitutales bacterium]|nr:LptF/LptG family permease [Opitutales bacterium]